MKYLIFRLVLPFTIISFVIFTKWWYVLVIDGADEIMYGFPLIYTCRGFATSMSHQFFIIELFIDLLTYFLCLLLIIYLTDRFIFTIRINKVVGIILLVVALISVGYSIFIMSSKDNIYLWKRDFRIEKKETGYKFLWQNKDKPGYLNN